MPRMIIAGVLACFAVRGAAQAQVAIGPNSVDAPYVHVDWGHGRVRVVAPFVNLCVKAPAGCQASSPPLQTSLPPSATRRLVTAGFSQPVETDKAELPSWTRSTEPPSAAHSHSAKGAEARDIAHQAIEELPPPTPQPSEELNVAPR